MTYSKDLKPKGEGGTLYTSRDLAAMQAEINALKAATAQLENQLADMADLTNTTVLRANAVQTHDISANLAVLGTAVVEGELAVSNGSGNDKDVIVNRNGVPEWGTPTDINAVNVLVTDTVTRATTVDHTGTVNEAENVANVDQCETVGEAQTVTQAENVANVDQCETVGEAQTVTQADTVTHADLVQVADVIQQTGDAQIVGDLDVTGSITQGGLTLDNTYIPQAEKGASNGVATLDSTGRVPASQLTIDAMEYQGKWNADTNTPTLADGIGTDGDFYIVSVAGTQDLGGGSISFNVNDSVIYNGTRWERIPAGQVDNVNGQSGEVVLTGLDIAESTTDSLPIDRRLKNWLFVDGQGASSTKTVRGYYSGSGVTLITFDTDNVYQGAIYLTISGVTAQVIINDNISDASHYQIPKGTYVLQKSASSPTYWIIETEYSVTASRFALKIAGAHNLEAAGLLDLVYPVGSVYWSSKATSPATLFGGTWTRIKDKFLWAMGDTDTANATGGAKTVSLSTANLPSHHHSFTPSGTLDTVSTSGSIYRVLMKADSTMEFDGVFSGSNASDPGRWSTGTSSPWIAFGHIKFSESHSHTFTGTQSDTGDTGSGTAHENMPPYICKYCWERTA